MQTVYEWDYETVDEFGDIVAHNHSVNLSDFTDEYKTDTLVLIRETGSDADGVQERTWAYVVDDRLPEYFSDAAGAPMHKVPKRFHIELTAYIANLKRNRQA